MKLELTNADTIMAIGTRDSIAKIADWVNARSGVAKYVYSGWEDSDPHYLINFRNETLKAEFILEFG